METKQFGGHVVETKTEDRNGVPVGIIAGHIAAWTPDIGGMFGLPDRFHPGAFLESIEDHKRRNNRQVRFKDHHGQTIGGFPIETVHEDSIGLFGRGEQSKKWFEKTIINSELNFKMSGSRGDRC